MVVGQDGPIRFGVLTVSTKGARGEREDTSGAALRELIAAEGWEVRLHAVVPDHRPSIAGALAEWANHGEVDVILTTGGTGVAPSDVTPEATDDVIQRPVPGLAEWLRASSLPHIPTAALGRGMAGLRGRTLIVNLPGSPGGARDGFLLLRSVLPHAVGLLRGTITDHSAPEATA